MAVLDSSVNKWQQVVKGAQIASQIGHCHSRDSFKKQQNLQKAIEEARKLAAKSPESTSRAATPIYLPDMTGSDMVELVRGDDDTESETSKKRVSLSPNVTLIEKQKTAAAPKISIDPPQLPTLKRQTAVPSLPQSDEPDLINLESAKSSPVPSIRKSANSSSSDSLDQILNTADIHASDDTESSEDKIISSPPIIISPPREDSIDSPSKSSLNSKAGSLDSLDNLQNKSDEELEAPEITDTCKNVAVTSPIKLTTSADKIVEYDEEKKSDKTEGDETTCLDDKQLEPKETDGSQYTVEFKEEFTLSVERKMSDESKSEVEPNMPIEQTTKPEEILQSVETEIEEIKPETVETKTEVADESSTLASKSDEISPSCSPTPKSQVPTPLTQRNIQRIQDRKREQPKYGWL